MGAVDSRVVQQQLARGELTPVVDALTALWLELRSPTLVSTLVGLANRAGVQVDPRVRRTSDLARRDPRPDEAAAIQQVVGWLRAQRKQPTWKAARVAMWSAIAAHPTDLALRQIIRDRLLEAGDPFAELVLLTSSAERSDEERARERALVASIGPGVYGLVVHMLDRARLALVHGFFESCVLYRWPRRRKATPLVTLRELSVPFTPTPVVQLPVICPALRSLRIGDVSVRSVFGDGHPTLERIEIEHAASTHSPPATKVGAFPALRSVSIIVSPDVDASVAVGRLSLLVDGLAGIVELSTAGRLEALTTWLPLVIRARARRFLFAETSTDDNRWMIHVPEGAATVEARLFGNQRASFWERRRLKAQLPRELHGRLQLVDKISV